MIGQNKNRKHKQTHRQTHTNKHTHTPTHTKTHKHTHTETDTLLITRSSKKTTLQTVTSLGFQRTHMSLKRHESIQFSECPPSNYEQITDA